MCEGCVSLCGEQTNKQTERSSVAELKSVKQDGTDVKEEEGVYYMKQTIGNACGTIALLHLVANNMSGPEVNLTIKPESFLDDFLKATKGMNPAEKGAYLENPPEGAPSIDSIHEVGRNGSLCWTIAWWGWGSW